MKFMQSALLALAIGAAAISSAQARDSFSIGINVGGHGYHEPVRYYAEPVYYSEPRYYSEPVRYYRAVPRYYGYAPSVVSFGYTNYGGHHYRGHHGSHHGKHHGWGRGHGGGHDGWKRGGRGHRDHDD